MFSKRFRRLTFVAIGLAIWIGSVAYRNRDQPKVRKLTWERDGAMCTVECEVWNPQHRSVDVKVTMRPVQLSDGEGPVLFGETTEFFYHIDAHASLEVKEELRGFPFGTPEVRVFEVRGPES